MENNVSTSGQKDYYLKLVHVKLMKQKQIYWLLPRYSTFFHRPNSIFEKKGLLKGGAHLEL